MSLFSYQIFETVAKRKSLVRAAEELNITPSAISHSLMKLEKAFGFPLLIRDKNGAALTRNGELLLPSIQAILHLEKKIWGEINLLNGLEKGRINLGAFNSVCCCWLPDILKSFKQKHPRIDIHIFQGGYADMENWLQSTKIDIGFISMPISNNLSVTPLMEDQLLCVTPITFKSLNPNYITINELRDQEFIFLEEGYDNDIKIFINNHNLSVNPHHKIKDDTSVLALVESGIGISIIPELVLK
ncbi:MAG: LysR family transcriptional regulator, partial [Sporomusa sp.]